MPRCQPLTPAGRWRWPDKQWQTAKAAERWAAKNPPEALSIIIRVWGVFAEYRPRPQRRWSRALVRDGAEARSAIAALRGVPAEEIGVRDAG
jgi:hypothetical protein